MYRSKVFSYTYEDWQNQKDAVTLFQEIQADPELPDLEEIVIGCWGEAWDDGSSQPLVDGIVADKERFAHIKSLFIGDMDYEECEVSWIIQADYSRLWEAMPQLEKLVIKGSSGLNLGTVNHENLRHLEIICGGLGKDVIRSVQEAKLPNLETLLLYIGVEDYGFDGDISTIKELLEKSDFPKLTYLGLTDSEIQNEITQAVLDSKYISQITTLDLSMGSLTDEGGQLLLDRLPRLPGIRELNLEYHFLSDEMMEKLSGLSGITVNVEDQQEADSYGGIVYYNPLLTE